ncbi:MAG: NERD domain-containing protein, partial [Pyrinomonadaceae bacterium]
MAVKHIACGRFANESERRAAGYLSSRLESSGSGGQWFLLTNYSSSSGSRHLSDEIDMVIVGPPGVSAIEIKHWSAADLKREAQAIAEREADKINEKAKRLASKVRKFCPFNTGFIAGKLLLTGGESEKFKEGLLRKRIRGVDVFGLSEWKDLLETYLTPVLSDQEVSSICRVLQPNARTSADGSLNIFQDYFELEPVTGISEPFHRVYRGRRKPGRDRVILHIYDLSATKEKKALDIARREFDTLQRLQKSQFLPSLLDSFQPAADYPGEMYFFSYIDTEAASLAERAKDKEWPIAARIQTAKRCVDALMELQRRGPNDANDFTILHRNLTPESIRIRSNGEPLLTQLHCAKLPDVTTLTGTASWNFAGFEEFVAPEVLISGLSACTVASDTYSLCASLSLILKDMDDDPLAERVLQILEMGLMKEPSERCTLETLSSDIEAVPLKMEEPKPVAIEFWDEDTPLKFQNRHYRIVTRLGAGSIGTTFKVMEIDPATGSELSGPYVAKAITNDQVGEAATLAYAKVRAQT